MRGLPTPDSDLDEESGGDERDGRPICPYMTVVLWYASPYGETGARSCAGAFLQRSFFIHFPTGEDI